MKGFIHELKYKIIIVLGITIFVCFGFRTHRSSAAEQSVKTIPMLSGPVTVLPWENDEAFMKIKRGNKVNELIAAYRTVLLDPLPGEEYNAHLAARLLCGTVVQSGSTFSMNEAIGPYTMEKGFKKGPTYAGTKLISTIGGGICKVATTLYNVAVLSDLHISERHYHNMPVSYVPYGQDATVNYGSYDFKFINNSPSPIIIWAQGINDTLFIGFYGNYKPPKIEWIHFTSDLNKTNTIYKKNKTLTKGTKRVLVEGMDGMTVKSFVKITYPDNSVAIKSMGISRYKPLPNIIEISE